MSDLNQAKASNLESGSEQSKLTAMAADGAGALIKEAMDEMIRSRNGSGPSGSDKSGSGASRANENGSISNEVKRPTSGVNDNGNRSSDESGKISDGISHRLERHRYEYIKRPQKDGVSELATGDTLIKDGNREILFMPNGDKLTVNKDGSFDLKAKGPVQVSKKGDTTTVTYPNGDSVSFGKNGVDSVTRGNLTVDILDKNILHELQPWLPTPKPQPNPPRDTPLPNPRPYPPEQRPPIEFDRNRLPSRWESEKEIKKN